VHWQKRIIRGPTMSISAVAGSGTDEFALAPEPLPTSVAVAKKLECWGLELLGFRLRSPIPGYSLSTDPLFIETFLFFGHADSPAATI
jgi:hypothetical protein